MAKVFSTEDVKQNNSIRVLRERLYSDVDLTLDARIAPEFPSGDGDVLRKTDLASVKQSIKTLLLTNRYEKPYRPDFGGDLGGLLFELMDENTGDLMVKRIKNAIQAYEPRAKVLDLKITANPNSQAVTVYLEFRVINTQFSDTLRIKLTDTPVTATPILPVTPDAVPDEILRTEQNERLLTLDNVLLRTDELGLVDGAILTVPFEDQLLSQDEQVLIVEQS